MIRRRRRTRAASGFLLFLVALMPLTLVGVALSADYTRALLAKRQATNAADVIAMAAATAIVDSTVDETAICADPPCPAALSARVRIDDTIAEERAQELFGLAESTGMLPANLEAQLVDVSVCQRGDLRCRGGREVSVTLTYKVPSFFVIRIITADDDEPVAGEVVRSAEICDPADLEQGAGAGCAYPLGG